MNHAPGLTIESLAPGLTEAVIGTRVPTNYARRRIAIRLIGLLAALLVEAMTTTGASAVSVRARYSLSYLGVQIGELIATSTVGPSTYETGLDARLTGIATLAATHQMSVKANGLLRNGTIVPSSYSAQETGSNENRTLRILLAAGNVKSTEVDPPIEDIKERVPLTDKDKRNVIDPASAFIMLVPAGERGNGPGACNRTLRLFTGFVRSNIELAYVRTEELKTRGYSGPVSVCTVRYVPIAGQLRDAATTVHISDNRGMEVRVAPVQDTALVMLVSVTVPMPLGTAVMSLEEYQVQPTPIYSNR
jgi:hypothetical protein